MIQGLSPELAADQHASAAMAARLTELAEQARQGSLLGISFIALTDAGAFQTGAEGIFSLPGILQSQSFHMTNQTETL
jgi:hypothetical protein